MEAARYLDYCKAELMLAEKTVENKRLYLYHFCRYMKVNGLSYEDLSIEAVETFFSSMNYTLASRHNAMFGKQFVTRFMDSGNIYRKLSNYQGIKMPVIMR